MCLWKTILSRPVTIFIVVVVFFSCTLTSRSVHVISYVALGPDQLNWRVKCRLLESRIPPLFLIPSRHPTPTSTFILIPSANLHVAPAHCNISSNELCTYMALHCCKWFTLEDKDQHLLKQKSTCCFVYFEAVWLTYHLACSRPIPHPVFKMALIPVLPLHFHPASRHWILCHPTSHLHFNPYSSPCQTYGGPSQKSSFYHFVLNCYHPLYFRTKKLLTSSSKWE